MRKLVTVMATGAFLVALPGCDSKQRPENTSPTVTDEIAPDAPDSSAAAAEEVEPDEPDDDPYEEARMRMVKQQMAMRDVEDPRVLEAMRKVPRHEFVPEHLRDRAYADGPLPIGHGQTISQPYIVAIMTQLADVEEGDRVLEIGTGSGYQAAVLGELGVELYSIEIVCELADRAKKVLDRLGHDDVHVRCGDGYEGWPEHAPFDAVVVTAAPPEIPEKLVEQLAPGGRMVVPVGGMSQDLKVIEKDEDGSVDTKTIFPVRFVPMVHGEDAG